MPHPAEAAKVRFRGLERMVKLELSEADYDGLLMMLGYAIGAAMRDDMTTAYAFLRLANRINKDNPNWTPYADPEELEAGT
jgi:hypothetical protein